MACPVLYYPIAADRSDVRKVRNVCRTEWSVHLMQGRKIMRRRILILGLIGLVLMLGLGLGYAQAAGPGAGRGGWYCPYRNTAAGGGYGRQAGSSRMRTGYGNGPGWGGGYRVMGQGGRMGRGWHMGNSPGYLGPRNCPAFTGYRTQVRTP
jgi:hypothetical protein